MNANVTQRALILNVILKCNLSLITVQNFRGPVPVKLFNRTSHKTDFGYERFFQKLPEDQL
jgi:hypothetical protein